MWSYFERMLQMLQEIPAYKNLNEAELLAAVFQSPKYIWMRRRNRVEQAVSWDMACQTGVWAQEAGEKPQLRAIPKFDFKAIDEWCNRIAAHEAGWTNYFRKNEIEPLILFYEDVVASHRAAAEDILKFLGLPFPPGIEMPAPAVEKQATQISEEWIARYLKLKHKRNGGLARLIRRMRV
jgi:LPS sulfotransferase NodH